MKILVKIVLVTICLLAVQSAYAQQSFSVQSGRWFMWVDENGSLTMGPGVGFRPGITVRLKGGSIDALLFKEKLRKSLKPGAVDMSGGTPRLPLQVVIYDGETKTTGTVADGRIWNEMMEILLPKAYPYKTDSIWKDYVEKYQAILPLDKPAGEPNERIPPDPDVGAGTDNTGTAHGQKTSGDTAGPPGRPPALEADRISEPKTNTSTLPKGVTDDSFLTISRTMWLAGIAVVLAMCVLWGLKMRK
jgi:hypothetical protein